MSVRCFECRGRNAKNCTRFARFDKRENSESGSCRNVTVDRPRTQAEHQADDAGAGIDVLVPDVGIEGKADARQVGKELVAALRAGHTHHQQRHLFVAVQQSAVHSVPQRLFAHRAGVHSTHAIQQGLQPLLPRSPVDAEYAVVFAREGVAVGVFQQ